MVIPQIVDLADVFLSLARDGRIGEAQQLVGGFAHRRDYHHGGALAAGFYDAGNTLDGGGGFHRRAAEIHNNHQSSIPSECISSAFNTAAPAAPRMVL